MRKQISIISGVVLAVALTFVPKARADAQNQATRLTFSQPVEIPGHKVLGAGTYWFMTPDDMAERNLVLVYNADQTKVITVIPTIAVDRPEGASHTEVDLALSEENQPDALVNWFYPGETIGHEFIYAPRQQGIINSEPLAQVMPEPQATAFGG